MEVKEGEILAIIGPNGAGKTCLLNVISGFYRAQEGEVFLEEKRITHSSSHRIAELGLCRTFQNIALYTGLSVIDNIIAGRHPHISYNFVTGMIYFPWANREEATQTGHRRRHYRLFRAGTRQGSRWWACWPMV